jgi:hypothetical protein
VKLMEAIVTKGKASLPSPPLIPAQWESEQEPGELQSSPVQVGDGPIQVVWSKADQMFNTPESATPITCRATGVLS